MLVTIYEATQNTMVLRSVEHPNCAAVISLPNEFDQELFLERANMAFDTLAQGIKAWSDQN